MSMNPKISDWTGKRVWLVGASSGIGAALAAALDKRGARLALTSRSNDRLQALGIAGALLLPCDATDPIGLAAAWKGLRATMGGADLVIYLAGDYQPMDTQNFNLNRAEQIVDTNYFGALRLTATLLPELTTQGLKTQGGGIAYVASVAGYRGLPRSLAYGPGKAALIHLAECLHLELAPKGIGVWLINPGFVATRLTAKNDFAMPAMLSPEQAAQETLKGFATGSFEIHYPKRFSRLLKLLSLLPYRWYFGLVRRITGG